jgi:phospholipase C
MRHASALALALAAAPLSESASPIKKIVVLMMENRSFDHMLGWYKTDVNPSLEGLVKGMTVPRDPNDPSQVSTISFALSRLAALDYTYMIWKGFLEVTRGGYDISPDDPLHNFSNITAQINGNLMNGFVANAISNGQNETNPISMFDQYSAPIINTLAREFAVFDRWFASVPGPTDPNRQYIMSGTSQGDTRNFNGTLYGQQTYFDYLRKHNRTFAGYYQHDLWGLGAFDDLVNTDNFQYIYELDAHFYADVAAGNMPDFTFLQPVWLDNTALRPRSFSLKCRPLFLIQLFLFSSEYDQYGCGWTANVAAPRLFGGGRRAICETNL